MNECLEAPCPHCGEALYFEPEPHEGVLEYVEDCAVCCRPILVTLEYAEGGSSLRLRKENP